jgi:TPR repeat protein
VTPFGDSQLTIKIGPAIAAGLILLGAVSRALAGPLEGGETAIRKGDYATAMTRMTPLAERGDKDAQYEVGRMYEGGQGVAKDDAKAASWYQKSALAGDHRAQLLLSLMYARGRGVPQDDKQGLYWLSKASADDPPQKQMAARSLYYQVRGSFDQGRQLSIPELTARALPWLQQQADQGDNHVKCALLQLYETGQAAARKSDDMASLHRTCAATGSESSRPSLPALPVPPPRTH